MKQLKLYLMLLILTFSVLSASSTTIRTSENLEKATIKLQVTNTTISIDGNANLNATAASEGWTGVGTEADPFILLLNINGPGSATLVEIRNTDLYFVIQDSNITNGDTGIYLENVQNGVINNSVVSNNGDGIVLNSSNNNLISLNNVTNNGGLGIEYENSHSNTILMNTITHNGQNATGLQLNIHLGGGILHDPSNHNQILNNSIGFNYGDGIEILDSINATIKHNSIFNNTEYGVNFFNTSNSIVESNWICNNGGDDTSLPIELDIHLGGGILHDPSDFNEILLNTICHNLGNGITLYDLEGSTVDGNEIYGNAENGIELIEVDDTTISNNVIYDNDGYGISMLDSDGINMTANEFSGNGLGDINDAKSEDVTETETETETITETSLETTTETETDFAGTLTVEETITETGPSADVSFLIIPGLASFLLIVNFRRKSRPYNFQ